MAMSDYSLSDLAAATGGGGGGLFGGRGGDSDLLALIILFAIFGNGFGNGFVGNRGFAPGMAVPAAGAGSVGGNELYPWVNQAEQVNAGFRDQMLMSNLAGIQSSVTSGFGDVQNALCAGFGGVNAGIAQGFAGAEIAANARQMADMQQAFAAQTAMMQGFNAQQAQLAQCCCDNRLATANQTATILAENCADRQAVSDALQAVTAQSAANTQRILDQMCQDKIAAKDDLIAQLRSELMYARGQASQDVQTAAIQAGQRTLANEIEQYVAPKAVPSYIVQNPNCCQQQVYGCGCGM